MTARQKAMTHKAANHPIRAIMIKLLNQNKSVNQIRRTLSLDIETFVAEITVLQRARIITKSKLKTLTHASMRACFPVAW